MTPIFVLTTRGLENVVADEMSGLAGVSVGESAYRRVMALCEGNLAPLLTLRTADDAYLDVGHWMGIGHTRDMLAVLRESAAVLDMQAAAATLRTLRDIPETPQFSVTASFVGKRNFNTDEIKQALAEGIATNAGWVYTPNDGEAAVNVRAFIDHETAFIGVRLGAKPLHERTYRAVERIGALKPAAAAAMLRLAGVTAGQTLLDPCCGSGTILIEAAAMGALPLGGDIDMQAVQAARANMRAGGAHFRIDQWDARRLPVGDGRIDALVTNLPWGRQIAIDEALADLYAEICLETARVLRVGGKAALLTTSPDLLQPSDTLALTGTHEISVFGQNAIICVFEKRA